MPLARWAWRRTKQRQVLEQWLPDALEDLESLITLGELEMQERSGPPAD